MGDVPREAFLAEGMAEFAYEDAPLPIEAEQTISQPYVVALMAEALELRPEERVLEVGTGSGYAAAVLGNLASEVYSVEWHEELADLARRRLEELGLTNVHVRQGDGSLGWAEHAPYDAVTVAAGGPEVPQALLDQLAVGGRLVMPVGSEVGRQELRRIVKVGEGELQEETLGAVRFVPLVGERGWRKEGLGWSPPPASGPGEAIAVGRPQATPAPAEPLVEVPHAATPSRDRRSLVQLLREEAEPMSGIEEADLGSLVERIGDARLVLLGEATHGTSQFYRFRSRLTRELVLRKGFDFVAVEADWPDAARIDRYVRHRPRPGGEAPPPEPAFTRFPTWMWRNEEVASLVEWLREVNAGREPENRVAFHGLDLYSLYSSISAVLRYLDDVDPDAAAVARTRYGCLTPWQSDPALYGRAVLSQRFEACEKQVVATLVDLFSRRRDYAERDGDRFFDAVHNARVAAAAEAYYRIMYYGSRESWNLRDRHMFETLQILLATRGESSRGIVWEHNSHVGDAGATEMWARGETNVGHLSREAFGDEAFLVGFGTDRGTVAAAHEWDGPMKVMEVRPSHGESYERLFHETEVPACVLHLREPSRPEVREELAQPRLERAIGVIYRPETELLSHYFQAVLPWQFDEYVWFDHTSAVTPLRLPGGEASGIPRGLPETYPFGL